ncbi:hypothetical protein [Calothrix anomala]|nr:hypothetical protein [Calothrix anomala]
MHKLGNEFVRSLIQIKLKQRSLILQFGDAVLSPNCEFYKIGDTCGKLR